MPGSPFSRRRFLLTAGLTVLAAPALAACGGAGQAPSSAAAPTTAPASAATSAPAAVATTAPSAAPTQASVAQPTAKPAATTASNTAGQNVTIGASVQVGSGSNWQSDAVKAFGAAHPNVKVNLIQTPNDQNAKKLLAFLATKTMPDVAWVGVKYMYYTASKGAFYALDSLVKTKDPGLDDYFPDAISSGKFEGKLYALPVELNTGNTNIVIYNKDMMDAKGVKEPTDEWTFDDFTAAAIKMTDAGKHIWGTSLLPENYYDLDCWIRSLGGSILSEDGKTFTLTSDPNALKGAQWVTELRTKHKAAPDRADASGLEFPSGGIGLFTTGIENLVVIPISVANKFKVGAVLAPVGPDGRRGYEVYLVQFSIAAQTKAPDAAYDLLLALTSQETSMTAFVKEGETVPRKSIWNSPEAAKISPVFARASAWLSNGKDQGPFPLPDNLRFQELQDKFGNLIDDVYYGDEDFDTGIKKVQSECQKIVALPRA